MEDMDINKEKKGDIDFEINFYEGILEKKGDFYQALTALGDLYTKKGMLEKGLDVDQRLAKLRPDDPIVFYNLSCSYSLMGMIEEALNAMKTSFVHGYDDFSYLEEDTDLANLLNHDDFKEVLSQAKKEQRANRKTDNS